MQVQSADAQNAHSRLYTALAYWILAGFLLFGIYAFNNGSLVLDFHSRDFIPIVIIPFALFVPALIYTVLAGRDWLWASRFGTSTLDLEDTVTGGQLRGVLRTANDIHASSDFVLRLQCIRSKEELVAKKGGLRGDSVIVDDVIGEWKHKVPASGDSSSAGVPFTYTLPPEMPPTAGAPGTKGAVRWALIASAPRAGMNYHAVFAIPVHSRPGGQHHEVNGVTQARFEPSGEERTLFETRLHQVIYLRPLAWFAGALIAGLLGFPLTSRLLVVTGFVDVILQVLQQDNTAVALTTYRLDISSGTFRRRRRELALQAIGSVRTKQSPLGRWLSYGTVLVTLVDGTQESYAYVARADELASRIHEYLS